MEITKEQVLDLYQHSGVTVQNHLNKWFPEAFKAELQVGKVYKDQEGQLINFQGGKNAYGFAGNYFCNNDGWGITTHDRNWQEAAIEEWESALIKEAKTRGYKNGNYDCLSSWGSDVVITDNYFFDSDGYLFQGEDMSDSNMIFKNGIWAEIIKTISKEDAEKQLGCKII